MDGEADVAVWRAAARVEVGIEQPQIASPQHLPRPRWTREHQQLRQSGTRRRWGTRVGEEERYRSTIKAQAPAAATP